MNQSIDKIQNFVRSLNSGDEKLNEKLISWLVWDKNSNTNREIQAMAKEKKWAELSERLVKRLNFGTSGLRGKLQAGFNAINELVIIQTTQGLALYMVDVFRDELCRGIAIGYDGRHQSERFATLTAAIFLNAGIPVNLFSTTVPTPFLSYCVKVKRCLAGIMITASHNPKGESGYKVYWSNSAAIISPHDANIQSSILNNLEPCQRSWDTSSLSNSNVLNDPLDEITCLYFNKLKEVIPCKFRQLNQFCTTQFVYSALHGVGYPYVQEGMEIFNIKNLIPVEEQKDPNPDFPTIKFPNPEEPDCFRLAMAKADSADATIILINDPDADRIAVAEKQSTGKWKIFSGNEVGSLLGWWALRCYQESNPCAPLKNCYMIASTVSSKLLKSMATIEGFKFEETLTGFKWMGNRVYHLIECECCKWNFLFAFEESIGYMVSSNVLDKDGISAAVHLATLVAYLQHSESKSLNDKLNDLYVKYGYHSTLQNYYLCFKKELIVKIFERIRNWKDAKGKYPESILNGKYKIRSIRDLTVGIDTSTTNGKPCLPTDPNSQMITFTFENGAIITLRTSGTEPKIKYYAELSSKPGEKDYSTVDKTIGEMLRGAIEEFLQPKENKLEDNGKTPIKTPVKGSKG